MTGGHSDDGAPAIEAAGLTKRYGDVDVLGPLDLRVPTGERVTLIGHNGSGKTTLLKLLTGLLEPSDGAARLRGHEPSTVEARAAVSYVADTPVFYDDLSVWEHVEYVARLHGTEDWAQHGVDLIEAMGLSDRIDDLPITFSRGLKQRASIVLGLCRPFDVLIVDEPFVGLDRSGRDALVARLRAAHRESATIVVATHEPGELAAGSRLIALREGGVVFDGSADGADIAGLVDRG